MNLCAKQNNFSEYFRHEMVFTHTGNAEIDRTVTMVMGYHYRSMLAACEHKCRHPTLYEYASALSPDFAHNALVLPRQFGLLPRYSRGMAAIHRIDWGKSYAMHGDGYVSDKPHALTLAGEHKAILEVINATDASEFCNKGASFGSIKSLLFSEIQSHTEDAELSKIILDEYINRVMDTVPKKEDVWR